MSLAWAPLQPTEPRFLQLHDDLLLSVQQLTQWATDSSREKAQALDPDPSAIFICQLLHYRHHWPMSWLILEVNGQQLELVLGTDTKLVRAKRPSYPWPSSVPTWEGYSLACPECGVVSHAPGLDPDVDPVGPMARANDLYHIHYDQAHRRPKEELA